MAKSIFAAGTIHSLVNSAGFGVDVNSVGATIMALRTPDRSGKLRDVALGLQNSADYDGNSAYFGAVIGRVAGRIGGAMCEIDGIKYALPANDNGNTLHGGGECRTWQWRVESATAQSLILAYTSPPGECGFPGKLEIEVIYEVSNDNDLIIDYAAKSSAITPINLTNHVYFNLNGVEAGDEDILNHEFGIDSSEVLEADSRLVATGARKAVAGTPFDLREPVVFKDILPNFANGIDDCYVLENISQEFLAAVAYSPATGIEMRVYTTELCIQFYTGNFLADSAPGKYGRSYRKHDGFCMETMGYQDSLRHAGFPPSILRPGETYRQRTVYKFLTR